MQTLRQASARGHFNHGWLDSYHSFSFADYHDPHHMNYGALRVINEDYVQPEQGFGMHGHRDMEIVTYLLSGALEHKDSMGNGSVIRPGDVQRMSAGTGVQHSEFNPSATESTHLLQIWLLPAQKGIAPGYEQKTFGTEEKRGRLRLIVAPDGADGAVTIHQDAALYAGLFDGTETALYLPRPGRKTYIHIARGILRVNGQELNAGDALKIDNEPRIILDQGKQAEILLFDLA
ncbi:MAG: pirin family protein [Alphaproteobacteria bacterium]